MTYILGMTLVEIWDGQEGLPLLEDAARRGSGAACILLGQRCFAAKRYEDARKYWQGASDAGIGEGTCALARLYREGLGVRQDVRCAVELYRKSSIEGFYEANNNLGVVLLNYQDEFRGLDVIAGALEAFEKGLAMDHTICFINVAGVISGRWVGRVDLAELDKKTRKRVEALVKIANARHDVRADWYMERMSISPLQVRGRQAEDNDPMSLEACAACLLKTTELMACGKCHSVYYCSIECQKADWLARHKKVCKEAGSGTNSERTQSEQARTTTEIGATRKAPSRKLKKEKKDNNRQPCM
jgi:TPR repeat protein